MYIGTVHAGRAIYAGREVEAKIDTMTFSLDQLVSCIQTQVEESSITPEALARSLERMYRSLPLEAKLRGTPTMDGVFKAVREECSLLNYSILERIAYSFHLRDAHEYIALYEKHIEHVTKLLNATEFAEQLHQAVKETPMASTSLQESITIVTMWGPNQKKVEDFRRFMFEAFSFARGYVHLIKVRPGSLQFTCYVPEQLTKAVTQLAQENRQVFQQFGVIQLKIGGVTVFEQLIPDPVDKVCL